MAGEFGLAPHLLNANPEVKLAFSRAAPWTDEAGRDVIFRDLGIDGKPTVETTGYYKNENNPAFVAGPRMKLDPGTSDVSEKSKALYETAAKARNYVDAQEGGGVFAISPDTKGLSIHVAMGRVPSANEMKLIGDIGARYKLTPANTADGVTMLNLAEGANSEFVSQLRPWLEYQVRKIVPEARATQVRHQGIYEDYSKLLAKENQGLGFATEDVLAALRALQKVDPRAYYRFVNSEGLKQKAAANLQRLEDYGGLGQRLDHELSLGILSREGWQGLIDHVRKHGSKGLPVVAGGAAGPVILGNSRSPDEL
jgi:hypothetical protein